MSKKDYDVGYGKPPKAGQFQPGQSGNPNGRPKGAKNLQTVFAEELQERIPIKEQGNSKKVTKQEAMVKALLLKALKGDVRAANLVIATVTKLTGDEPMIEDQVELSKTDQMIIDEFAKHMAEKVPVGKKDNGK